MSKVEELISKKQEERLNFFATLITNERCFNLKELYPIPLTESALMFFSGIFVENKTCNKSIRSICRLLKKSHPNWNDKIMSQFVFRDSEGIWQLTDSVKDRIEFIKKSRKEEVEKKLEHLKSKIPSDDFRKVVKKLLKMQESEEVL